MDRLQWLYPIYAVQGCCHMHLLRFPFHMEKKFASHRSTITGRLCCLNWAFFNRLSEYKPLWDSNPFSASPAWISLSSTETNDYNPVRLHALQATIQTSHTIQPPLVREDAIVARQPSNSIVNNPFSFNETAFLFLY